MRESDSFPQGYHTVNPYLVIGNVLEFIKFSELVFDAVLMQLLSNDLKKKKVCTLKLKSVRPAL